MSCIGRGWRSRAKTLDGMGRKTLMEGYALHGSFFVSLQFIAREEGNAFCIRFIFFWYSSYVYT